MPRAAAATRQIAPRSVAARSVAAAPSCPRGNSIACATVALPGAQRCGALPGRAERKAPTYHVEFLAWDERSLGSTSAILRRAHLIQVRSRRSFCGRRGLHDGSESSRPPPLLERAPPGATAPGTVPKMAEVEARRPVRVAADRAASVRRTPVHRKID